MLQKYTTKSMILKDTPSGFWPNLDPVPDPYPGLCILSIMTEKMKNNLREKQFSLNTSVFLRNNSNQMLPKQIFTQLSLFIVNFYLEYFSFIIFSIPNTDPDPESS